MDINIKGGVCMAIKPLGDRVLVKVLEAKDKTESGIYLPTLQQQNAHA